MRNSILFTYGLFLSIVLFGQEEKPYFQQEINYTIKVELDDINHELVASETIEYTNNSTDKISYIYFHLWPNAYKNYNSALGNQKLEAHDTRFYHADDSERGFIDGLNFTSNENVLQWELDDKDEDICLVYLTEPLLPGETVNISTPFNVKLPKGVFSRLGHINESYQITQWFPKPAVYDKSGWHQMPYLDQGEFYSEYGTFDVFITLPKNYIVGATGDLVDNEKELTWLNELAKKTALIDSFDYNNMDFPTSSDTTKTLHYHQENIHDFAWFADKRYHVLKGEVELPHSKRKVTTWAMFTNNEAYLWKKSISYLNDATYYYSLWNGDYPYNHVTAVDGALSAGGGMEYPNVTVIGESGDDFGLETVIMHEVGHNWFYGILGSNERDHPWMDEGLNSMNENRYIETKYPNRGLMWSDSIAQNKKLIKWFDLQSYKHKSTYELMYLLGARKNLDQAIEEKSEEYTPMNYGGIVYSKTAIAFDYLMAYLGENTYDKCMKRYFEEWKFKHPHPNDLRKIFEEETGKDLDWFFDDVIKTTKKIDYKILGSKKDTSNPENILLKINNKGKVNGPFSISGVKDGTIVTTQWFEPIKRKEFISIKQGDFDNYKIDAELNIPENNRKNNTLKTKGFLKKMEPLRIQYLGSIENPDKTQFFFTPIAGWNMNDQVMAGLAFYNSLIPTKKFEYVVAPMYAFGSKNINGYANAVYHIRPNNIFQEINIGVKSSSFSYLSFDNFENTDKINLEYYKIAPQLTFYFKKRRARQFNTLFLNLRNVNIFEEHSSFNSNTKNYDIAIKDFYVNQLTFGMANSHPINPFVVTLNVDQAKDFVKLDLSAKYRFAYKRKGTGLDIRFFMGRFLYNDKASTRFNYGLSGNSDYLYDHVFLARNTIGTLLSQQSILTDGGFKNLTTTSSSNNWINAINVKSNLFTRFLSIYGDVGLSSNNTKDYRGNDVEVVSDAVYNIGLSLNPVPGIFEVYFPLKMSSDLNQLSYGEKIRFVLNINLIKPLEQVRNIGF